MPGLDPARVLVDANVFARRDWMEPLLDAADAGHVTLLWCPTIIAEASKVLLWIWLQRRGGQMTESLKREAFDVARRWFERMTTVFKVVEDCPPYEPQWTDTPRDANDRPIWTAAVRSNAHFIVTENLKDGPSGDDEGYRLWHNVVFIRPYRFLSFLGGWDELVESSHLTESEGEVATAPSVTDDAPTSEAVLSPLVRRYLRLIAERAAVELPPAEQPE